MACLLFVTGLLLLGFAATRYLAHRAETLHPASGSFVEIEGLQQHYLERGDNDAPPIVLVHGAFGAAKDYALTILDDLAADYHCIAWDRPGHGYSERPEDVTGPDAQARILLGLIHKLGLKRPLVVGFSYGGAVALATALDGHEHIRGIVMLNGPSHPWPDPTNFEYRLPAFPVIGPLVTSTLLSPLGHLLSSSGIERVFAPEPVTTTYAESPVELSLRPATYRANAEDIRVLKPYLVAQVPRYADLSVPVTMVVSEQDPVVSPTIHSLQLERVAPRFAMRRLEGAGHQILYTQPDIVLEEIRNAMR